MSAFAAFFVGALVGIFAGGWACYWWLNRGLSKQPW